jgi:hypothetical protein
MKKPNFSALKEFNFRHAAKRLSNLALEGWYVKGDAMSQDRMRLLMCNYTSNIIGNLVGGTFWTGFLLLLNADDAFIGSMSMIATAANMLQFLAPLLLERFPRRKAMLTVLRGILYILNVAFVCVIPLFPVGAQFKLTMLAITILLVNIINAIISPGLTIWHVQSVPNNVRQQYYSLITMTVGAVVALVNLGGSAIVDIMTARGMEYAGFAIVRGIALALCAVEMVLYSRIKEYPYESSGRSFSFKELFTEPFKNKLYMRTVAVVFLWCFAANIPGSYYTVYLLRDLGVSYSYITVLSMLNVPVVLLLTPAWRKVLGKFGWFKTLYVAMAVYLAHYIILAMVGKGTLFLYPVALILAYVFAIGINLSFTGIPYVNMPAKNQTMFIGFYSSVSNLAALLGVTLGKYFVLFTEEMHLNIFGFMMGNKQALMLVTAALLVGATIGIRAIDKKTPQDQ